MAPTLSLLWSLYIAKAHKMEDAIPSLSTGVVGSRFVSQEELDTAKARRQEQWKAAYARYDIRQTASGTCAA